MQIAERVAERVAQLAVRLGKPGQNHGRDADVFGELHRSGPEPNQFGAVFLDDFFGRDCRCRSISTAGGRRHRASIRVLRSREIGRAVAQAHADQQRTLEPAAILIAAFHVEIGRPAQAVFLAKHREMARSGIEPDVENVVLFRKFRRAALLADRPGGNEFSGGALEPDIGRVLFEKIDDAVENRAVGQRFAACRAVEDHDRHAPDALARNTPVGPARDHVRDALFAPFGNPFDALDGIERSLAQAVVVHSDEPLVGGAEDGRVVAAPAVRIGMLDVLDREQRAVLLSGSRRRCGCLPKRSCRGVAAGRCASNPCGSKKRPAGSTGQ